MHLAQNKIGPYFIGKTIVWQKIDWLSQLVDKITLFVLSLGPKMGSGPVKCISQHLVRKANSNNYYTAKVSCSCWMRGCANFFAVCELYGNGL